MVVSKLPPVCDTDPYKPTPDAPVDTLVDKPSTTPLMGTLSRAGVLVLVAAMLYQRRGTRHSGGGVVEGLEYPADIQIHGIRQSFVGGGALSGANFVAGAYFATSSATSRALSTFVDVPAAELRDAGFFRVLEGAQLRQSLLFQWIAPTSREEALRMVGDVAGPGSAALTDALRPLLGPAEVLEGADLFLTCTGGALIIAYAGEPTDHVRNTARVGARVDDAAACPSLWEAVLGREAALSEGIGAGFEERSHLWR